MQHENSSVPLPHTRAVVQWNKGRFVGPKPPLEPKQVWAIRIHLQRKQRVRDLAMFDLAIDSKLRGCDLVKLKIGQVVVNAAAGHRATIVQQKTERPVRFELTEQTRESLTAWLNHRGGTLDDYVFPSRNCAGSWSQSVTLSRIVSSGSLLCSGISSSSRLANSCQ
jgi:integrase